MVSLFMPAAGRQRSMPGGSCGQHTGRATGTHTGTHAGTGAGSYEWESPEFRGLGVLRGLAYARPPRSALSAWLGGTRLRALGFEWIALWNLRPPNPEHCRLRSWRAAAQGIRGDPRQGEVHLAGLRIFLPAPDVRQPFQSPIRSLNVRPRRFHLVGHPLRAGKNFANANPQRRFDHHVIHRPIELR